MQTGSIKALPARDCREFLRVAEAYLKRGWRVLPLLPPARGDENTGKRPLPSLENWPEQRLMVEDLREFWSGRSCPNLGILTGYPSGIVVLDFGDPEAGKRWRQAHPEACNTYTVARDNAPEGKFHAYFAVPAGDVPPSTKGDGWDFLSTGRQVCAPPSVHWSGGVYRVVLDVPLLEWCPAWLPPRGHGQLPNQGPAPQSEWVGRAVVPARAAALILNGVAKGTRNDTAFRLACELRDAGFAAPEAESMVREFAGHCTPPLSPGEALGTLRSAYSRPAASPPPIVAAGEETGPRPAGPPWPEIGNGLRFAPLPPFPADAMPPILGSMATEVSETIRAPVEATALSLLTVVGACIGRDLYVRVKAGVEARANLFSFIFMARGERKSSIFTPAIAPLQEWIGTQSDDYRKRLSRLGRKQRQMKLLEGVATAPKVPRSEREQAEERIEALQSEIEQDRAQLRNPAFLAEDATPEALVELMAETGGLAGVFTDDARSFLKLIMGLYTSGETREDVHIRAFDGTSPIRRRRAGVGTVTIDRPCEGILLLVQTDYLVKLGETGDFFESGYVSRNLFCVPDSWVGRRGDDGRLLRAYSEREIDAGVRDGYRHLVHRLLDEAAARPGPVYMELSLEAKQRWAAFHDAIEEESGEGGRYHETLDFSIRYAPMALRLALLHAACAGTACIEVEHMEKAIRLVEYYAEHGGRAQQAMRRYLLPDGARRVLKRVRDKRLSSFSLSEMQRGLGLPTAEKTAEAISVLVRAGYCRPCPPPDRDGRPGRSPSPEFDVNPAVHEEAA